MRKLAYKKIDAFTSEKSLGNPAACVYLGKGETLTPGEMQDIARQHKGFVSEMVFCESSEAADCKLTYFSSECEVEFCGHGTIACMYDLAKNRPPLRSKPLISIETNRKGTLTVFNEIEKQDAVYITAPNPRYMGTELSAAAAAEALGIAPGDVDGSLPLDVINAGLTTLLIPIADLQREISIFPQESRLKAFCEKQGIDIILAFSRAATDPANKAHTRVFAPKYGYLEDPATGSGSSAFGYYMLKRGLWKGEPIVLEQGGRDREFNPVRLSVRDGRVLFGGSATLRIDGTYYL